MNISYMIIHHYNHQLWTVAPHLLHKQKPTLIQATKLSPEASCNKSLGIHCAAGKLPPDAKKCWKLGTEQEKKSCD